LSLVKIIECPRDAWQGLPKVMPTEVKADYLRALVAAGFRHIDAVSFVSPAAVPQMADAEFVLEYLDPPDDVEVIGVVVNRQGAERAVETNAVQTVGFPYSVSETFLKRNQAQTPEEAVEALEEIGSVAQLAGVELIAYISMAFGNPYGDAWSIDEVLAACELLVESGAKAISLADTVGLATPLEVSALVGSVMAAPFAADGSVEIGVHLHARPQGAAAKVRAAYEAGCRRFDSTIGGMGGCPFAQDALVGNIATEMLIAELASLGAELPPVRPLEPLIRASAEIFQRYGPRIQ
jgi:hydroxymethylglutaryl-CoA lyase